MLRHLIILDGNAPNGFAVGIELVVQHSGIIQWCSDQLNLKDESGKMIDLCHKVFKIPKPNCDFRNPSEAVSAV